MTLLLLIHITLKLVKFSTQFPNINPEVKNYLCYQSFTSNIWQREWWVNPTQGQSTPSPWIYTESQLGCRMQIKTEILIENNHPHPTQVHGLGWMLNTKQKYPKFHSVQMQLRTGHPIIPLPTTLMRSSAALWDGQLQAAGCRRSGTTFSIWTLYFCTISFEL